MRIFVTGGSGFVGGHVIETLSGAHEVVALARSARSAAVVEGFGATAVRGDLESLSAEHVAGCDGVVHAAAYVESWGPIEAYREANMEGTRRALEAAKAAGVRRFVHIGTEAVLFDGQDLVDVDERVPIPDRLRWPYPQTKAEAEKLVRAASTDGFDAIVLRPRMIWGPRDQTILAAIRQLAEEGGWIWIDGGRAVTSTCHVANLVEAVRLVLEGAGEPGEAYFIADDGQITVREFFSALAAAAGVTLPGRSMPGALVLPIVRAVDGAWSALRPKHKPPVSAYEVLVMSRTCTVRTDKARAELGWAPVIDREQGLAALADA